MLGMWPTLGILLAGVVVVVGSILVFRLHAFLALFMGALVVAGLTPPKPIELYQLQLSRFKSWSVGEDQRVEITNNGTLFEGTQLLVVRPDTENRTLPTIATLTVQELTQQSDEEDGETIAHLALQPTGSAAVELQDSDLIVHPKDREAARDFANDVTVGERVADGFGKTCLGIGILIALAAIVGKCLLDSGAADRIVRSSLNLVGEKNAPVAFAGSSFALGIPVFFDTVFYLMIPIGKATRMRTGKNYLLYVLAMVCGGAITHSLVPPTPGPLFVAEELGVSVGLMIMGGCIVGLVGTTVGLLYATFLCRFVDLPLRPSPDLSLEDLKEISERDDSDLPPTWLALLPIILPVILISGYTILDSVGGFPESVMKWARTFGNKNIAMGISAAISIYMVVVQKKENLAKISESIQNALASGGTIILITAAGGAFGKVLQQTGAAGLVTDVQQVSPVMILLTAFLITAAVRAAQGSATVSMITGVGVMSGLAASGDLGFHPLYIALAIGCGSKMFMWMNDSGFWVIGKMSGMTEMETLKYVMPMTSLMGLVGLATTIIGVLIWPMG